jgi:hypothetical protein
VKGRARGTSVVLSLVAVGGALGCGARTTISLASSGGSSADASQSDHGDAGEGGPGGSDGASSEGGVVTLCSECAGPGVCVVATYAGGPCVPADDAGVCPYDAGWAPPGHCCNITRTVRTCHPTDEDCLTVNTCDCYGSLCPEGCQCEQAATPPTGEVECGCFAP